MPGATTIYAKDKINTITHTLTKLKDKTMNTNYAKERPSGILKSDIEHIVVDYPQDIEEKDKSFYVALSKKGKPGLFEKLKVLKDQSKDFLTKYPSFIDTYAENLDIDYIESNILKKLGSENETDAKLRDELTKRQLFNLWENKDRNWKNLNDDSKMFLVENPDYIEKLTKHNSSFINNEIKNLKQKVLEEKTKLEEQKKVEDNAKSEVARTIADYINGLQTRSEESEKSLIEKSKDDIIKILTRLNTEDIEKFKKEVKDGKTLLAKYKDLQSIQHSFGKTAKDFNFLSVEYDKFFSNNEIANSFYTVISPCNQVPFFGLATSFTRIFQLGDVKMMKTQELYYICSACLAFTSLNSVNIKKMLVYFSEHGIKTELTPIFNLTQTNCYKFFYFLIQQINFDSVDLGMNQYNFWNGFINMFDFDENSNSLTKFKYSFKGCVSGDIVEDGNGIMKGSDLCNSYNDIIVRTAEENVVKMICNVITARYHPTKYLNYDAFKINLLTIYKKNERIRGKVDKILHKDSNGKKLEFGGRNRKTLNNKKIKNITKRRHTKYSKGGANSITGWVTGVGFVSKYLLGNSKTLKPLLDPEQKYREMLREYVIISGNMTLLLSEFTTKAFEMQDKINTDQSQVNQMTILTSLKDKIKAYLTLQIQKEQNTVKTIENTEVKNSANRQIESINKEIALIDKITTFSELKTFLSEVEKKNGDILNGVIEEANKIGIVLDNDTIQ
jgi:hypothetical protein